MNMKKLQRQRRFDKRAQRGELLARNKVFLSELANICNEIGRDFFTERKLLQAKEKEIAILKSSWRDSEISLEEGSDEAVQLSPVEQYNKEVISLYDRGLLWDSFCYRWGILPQWDGNTKSLRKHQRPPVEVYRYEGMEVAGSEPALMLRINAWTSIADVEAIWSVVVDEQRKLSGKQEDKNNFVRDLKWYDMRHSKKMSFQSIANEWVKNCPEELETIAVRSLMKSGTKNTKDALNKASKWQTNEEILREIKGGNLSVYKDSLDQEIGIYFKSESGRAYATSRSVDIVRKAVERMEDNVNRVTAIQAIPEGRKMVDPYEYVKLERVDIKMDV